MWSGRLLGKGTGDTSAKGAEQQDRMDVLGCAREGRGEMQGELWFCFSLFLQRVSALSTYVLVGRLVTWHGKLSVGNAVSVQTVLVIRAWSRTVCVVLFYSIALGIK